MFWNDEERGLPNWLLFLLALPVGFLLIYLLRKRAERRDMMAWQMEEDAFRERQQGVSYDPQRREAFMGESAPADAARSLPTSSPLSGRASGDEAETIPDELRSMRGEIGSATRTGSWIGGAQEGSSMPEDISPVSDEAIAADLQDEDVALETPMAVTGAPAGDAALETTEFDQTRDAMGDQISTNEAAATVETQLNDQRDDLALIEGIGPAISNLLVSRGITTFQQLANTPVERLDEILTEVDLRRIADPGTWPEQARYAANGDMEGLEALQRTLKAGRRME